MTWRYGPLGSRGPGLDPADLRARLIIEYLIEGQFRLGSAAAMSLARLRGDSAPLTWVSPSYEQLLIGYACALTNDARGLAAWSARTQADRWLGSDGLVLDAYASSLAGDHVHAIDKVARLEHVPLPLLPYGLELGVKLAAEYHGIINGSSRTKDPTVAMLAVERLDALAAVYRTWMRPVAEGSPFAGPVVLPATSSGRFDVSDAGWFTRAYYHCQYVVERWFRHYVVSGKIDLQQNGRTIVRDVSMQGEGKSAETPTSGSGKQEQSSALNGPALWVATGALVVWLGFTIYLLFRADSEEVIWARLAWVFGSVEAVAFAAAGALFAHSVQRDRVDKAESRAAAAEQDAKNLKDEASKGRALAAVVQADAEIGDEEQSDETPGPPLTDTRPNGQIARRHADVARALFGELV
jgi:hypothetical protein